MNYLEYDSIIFCSVVIVPVKNPINANTKMSTFLIILNISFVLNVLGQLTKISIIGGNTRATAHDDRAPTKVIIKSSFGTDIDNTTEKINKFKINSCIHENNSLFPQ